MSTTTRKERAILDLVARLQRITPDNGYGWTANVTRPTWGVTATWAPNTIEITALDASMESMEMSDFVVQTIEVMLGVVLDAPTESGVALETTAERALADVHRSLAVQHNAHSDHIQQLTYTGHSITDPGEDAQPPMVWITYTLMVDADLATLDTPDTIGSPGA